ncbi:MAG: hypothetical protein RIS70_3345 [Planctomycetota bacterium]
MASPFAAFRRNQRLMLAIFGIICMIVFVVGSFLDDLLRGQGTTQRDEVVVTWAGGSVDEQQLNYYWSRHTLTLQFMNMLAQETIQRKGTPRFDMRIEPAQRDDDILDKLILARKAEEMGIVVSDQAVSDYLAKFCDEQVAPAEQQRMVNELLSDRRARLSSDQIFEQIRTEIAARTVGNIAFAGVPISTPATVWKYYNRVNRRVQVELLPLAVADYVDKTREPSEAEVKELYEKHKNQPPFPSSPEPGFRRRKQIAIRYFKVDYDKLLEEEKAKLTPEEIQKEYDERISRGEFKQLELPGVESPSSPAKETSPDLPDSEKPADEKPADSKPAENNSPEENKPAAENKPAEEKKPAPPEGDKPEPQKGKADEPGTPEPSPEKPAEQPRENPASPSQGVTGICRSDDPKPEGKEEQPAQEPPATDKPATEKPAEGKPATEKPATEKPAEEKPAEEKPAEAAAPAAPKYKPLEEVQDQVATLLAKPRAQKELDRRAEAVKRKVDQFGREYHEWVQYQDETDFKGKPEPTLDVDALAKEFGVESVEIPLVDQMYFLKHELGNRMFLDEAFSPRLQKNRPQQFKTSNESAAYVWWKTDERAEETPELKSIRDEVVAAWKKQEAVKLAKEDAKSRAKEAEGKESLKAAFGEPLSDKVSETPEFTWIASVLPMMLGGTPSLGEVEGVDTPGNEFMEAVFALKEGEVGVAVNFPQTYAYVVRLAKESMNESDRRERFLIGRTQEFTQLSQLENRDIFVQWILDLRSEMKVNWQRPSRIRGMME